MNYGDLVLITKGKHKGSFGEYDDDDGEGKIIVYLFDKKEEIYIKRENAITAKKALTFIVDMIKGDKK